ncbi:hypothetical protein B0O99DRAFT_600660 [Bisporella sp. PMI_857]|nr:hypothetical protein B0O99DRAFT_600660 [Bisporella sp. PMI_857]
MLLEQKTKVQYHEQSIVNQQVNLQNIFQSRNVDLKAREKDLETREMSVGTRERILEIREQDIETRAKDVSAREHNLDARDILDSRQKFLEEGKDYPYDKEWLRMEVDSLARELTALHEQELYLIYTEWSLKQQLRLRPKEYPNQEALLTSDKFTLFVQLPPELRLKIWEQVETPYEKPRIHVIRGMPSHLLICRTSFHSVRRHHDDSQHVELFPIRDGMRPTFDRVLYLSPHGVHPVLHVCHEPRSLFMRKFKLEFAFSTLVNFSEDTIFIDSTPCLGEKSESDMAYELHSDVVDDADDFYDDSDQDDDEDYRGYGTIDYLTKHPLEAELIQRLALQTKLAGYPIRRCAQKLGPLLKNLKEVNLIVSNGRPNQIKDYTLQTLGEEKDVYFTDDPDYEDERKALLYDPGEIYTTHEEDWMELMPVSAVRPKFRTMRVKRTTP